MTEDEYNAKTATILSCLHYAGTTGLPDEIKEAAEACGAWEGDSTTDWEGRLWAWRVTTKRDILIERVPGTEAAIDELIRTATACGQHPGSLRAKEGRPLVTARNAAMAELKKLLAPSGRYLFRTYED